MRTYRINVYKDTNGIKDFQLRVDGIEGITDVIKILLEETEKENFRSMEIVDEKVYANS